MCKCLANIIKWDLQGCQENQKRYNISCTQPKVKEKFKDISAQSICKMNVKVLDIAKSTHGSISVPELSKG